MTAAVSGKLRCKPQVLTVLDLRRGKSGGEPGQYVGLSQRTQAKSKIPPPSLRLAPLLPATASYGQGRGK